jgi:NADH-quinone oxidoreductase subunit E
MEQQVKAEAEEIKEKTGRVLAQCERDRSRLIPTLQTVQNEFGYLPEEAMREVASFLGMTDVEIYGVASFYNHFRFVPLGKHPVQICMGTACHMVGGGLVMEALERSLDIKVGEVTEDREFSLDRVACVGCCSLAPVMVIGEKIYPKTTGSKVDEALVKLKIEAQEAMKGDKNG